MSKFESGFEAYAKLATIANISDNILTISLVFVGFSLAGFFAKRDTSQRYDRRITVCLLGSSILFTLTAVFSASYVWSFVQFDELYSVVCNNLRFAIDVYENGLFARLFLFTWLSGFFASIFVSTAIVNFAYKTSKLYGRIVLLPVGMTYVTALLLVDFSANGLNDMFLVFREIGHNGECL